MNVFISYTLRDGLITRAILKRINDKLCGKCNLFIDLLHNKSANPQAEIFLKVASSNVVMQINTPAIRESEWVTLERDCAKSKGIPVYEVDFLNSHFNSLFSDINKIIDLYLEQNFLGIFNLEAC